MLKKERGVTLISLVITVIVMLIIGNIVLYNAKDNLGIEKIRYLKNDIENLRDKVSIYYEQYGTLPIKIKYGNIANIKEAGLISNVADTGDFYVIDLSALDNLTLTYGKDYENIKAETTEETVQELKDLYIINEASHNIFYVKGITFKEKVFYANYNSDKIDKKQVDLRYVENVKIPDGYTYIEGTKESGIRIKVNDDSNKTYKWIEKNYKITEVPSDININANKNEEFLNSVNSYKGYYKSENDQSVIYLPLEDNWSDAYDIDAVYKDKSGQTVTIPKGFCVSKLPEENEIDKGLVIKNSETNDKYVWIKVPKNIYETAESEKDYENIENDMRMYTSDYTRGRNRDEWYSGCGIDNEVQYTGLKNKMLESTYLKGGFWISQYEIGAAIPVVTNEVNRTAKSQQGLYPYNFVTCAQAQKLAKEMNTGDLNSSLLFGIQWNLTIKFIEENGGIIKNQINVDTTSWANVSGASFIVEKGKYNTLPTSLEGWKEVANENNGIYRKNNGISVLMTTGATKRNSVLNIYDFAGNLSEWILEYSTDESKPCVVAGDSYNYEGESSKQEYYSNIANNNGKEIGFRTTMY